MSNVASETLETKQKIGAQIRPNGAAAAIAAAATAAAAAAPASPAAGKYQGPKGRTSIKVIRNSKTPPNFVPKITPNRSNKLLNVPSEILKNPYNPRTDQGGKGNPRSPTYLEETPGRTPHR